MGGSTSHGKPSLTKWFFKHFENEHPLRILDIGCGSGNYRRFLKRRHNDKWIGIEAWGPNVEKYNLLGAYVEKTRRGRLRKRMPYDHVEVCEAKDYDWRHGPFDLVIAGDVLEHMLLDDAVFVVMSARKHSRWVAFCVPFGSAQDAIMGNPYQEHLTMWSLEMVHELFPDVERLDDPSPKGDGKGMFLLRGEL